MHAQIDQARNELLTTLEEFNKEIEEKKDQWKTYLADQLEQNVGCLLTEELQNYESDGMQMKNARLEYIRLQKLFHSLNNQQLITMTHDTDDQVILHPPLIVCSDIFVNGFNFMENFQVTNSDEETIEFEEFDTTIDENSSCKCNFL